MKKIILFIVLAALCLNFTAQGQFYKPSPVTIHINETLPETFYQKAHQAVNTRTGKLTTIQLKQFKDKLIILDFWATWCGPCVYSLNKLDSIKMAMNGADFIVVPVTYQSEKEAKTEFNRYKWDFTSIIGDTILAQIFPHSGIPHQVWIRSGKVIAFPKSDYATKENILNAIAGKPIKVIQNIQDNALNPLMPLFTKGNGETGLYFKGNDAVIARYLPNYDTQTLTYLTLADTTVLYCCNLSLSELFFQAFRQDIFPAFGIDNGVEWNISPALQARFLNKPHPSLNGEYKQDSIYLAWRKKNNYGYNLRYPKPINEHQALRMMQQDLNHFFGLYLNLEAKIKAGPKHIYAVLRLKGAKTETEGLLKSKSDSGGVDHHGDRYRYKNLLFGQHFLGRLSSSQLSPKLTIREVIDSTGIDPNFRVDFDFAKSIKGNLDKAQKELSRYGLYLTIEKEQVPVLEIRDKNIAPSGKTEFQNKK